MTVQAELQNHQIRLSNIIYNHLIFNQLQNLSDFKISEPVFALLRIFKIQRS